MGDENATGQPADDQEQAGTGGGGTSGSIYSGQPAPAQPDAGDDPDKDDSIYSGGPDEPGNGPDEPGNGDDGPPDDGSIYSG